MSVLVKWTMPRYPVAGLPNASRAVTVTVAVPAANGFARPDSDSEATVAAVTAIEA